MIKKITNVNKIKKCSHIFEDGTHCEVSTNYRYVLNEDGNKVRDYNKLCPKHEFELRIQIHKRYAELRRKVLHGEILDENAKKEMMEIKSSFHKFIPIRD